MKLTSRAPYARRQRAGGHARITFLIWQPQVLVSVMTGMREILPRLQKYLATWDRYKHIWDVDKDAFMRR